MAHLFGVMECSGTGWWRWLHSFVNIYDQLFVKWSANLFPPLWTVFSRSWWCLLKHKFNFDKFDLSSFTLVTCVFGVTSIQCIVIHKYCLGLRTTIDMITVLQRICITASSLYPVRCRLGSETQSSPHPILRGSFLSTMLFLPCTWNTAPSNRVSVCFTELQQTPECVETFV